MATSSITAWSTRRLEYPLIPPPSGSYVSFRFHTLDIVGKTRQAPLPRVSSVFLFHGSLSVEAAELGAAEAVSVLTCVPLPNENEIVGLVRDAEEDSLWEDADDVLVGSWWNMG